MYQEDTRTIEQLAVEVLSIQDASNFTAVASAFGRAMQRLRRLTDTDGRNHPITFMWMSKLESLMGEPANSQDFMRYGEMHAEVQRMAGLKLPC